jgi:DNA-binding transcriptional regulator LsrR (DeoR family)
VLSDASSVDIPLFGIGSNVPGISSLVRSGYLGTEESATLLAAGAVATVCGLQIDAAGEVLATDVNEKLVGIDRAILGRISTRLRVAAGAEKAPAVLAALRGHWITMLVVDEPVAEAILAT